MMVSRHVRRRTGGGENVRPLLLLIPSDNRHFGILVCIGSLVRKHFIYLYIYIHTSYYIATRVLLYNRVRRNAYCRWRV